MIMGPADYALHDISLATTMNSTLYCLIIATILSLLYPLGHKSALSLSRTEVLCIAFELMQFALIVSLQRLLADQRFYGYGQA